jgi:hypothetical protein
VDLFEEKVVAELAAGMRASGAPVVTELTLCLIAEDHRVLEWI